VISSDGDLNTLTTDLFLSYFNIEWKRLLQFYVHRERAIESQSGLSRSVNYSRKLSYWLVHMCNADVKVNASPNASCGHIYRKCKRKGYYADMHIWSRFLRCREVLLHLLMFAIVFI